MQVVEIQPQTKEDDTISRKDSQTNQLMKPRVIHSVHGEMRTLRPFICYVSLSTSFRCFVNIYIPDTVRPKIFLN